MRSMRLAALTVAITLAFSGLALARDHDDDHNRDKHADRHHDWDHGRDRDWNRDRDHDRDHNGWWDHDRDHDRWQREHRGWWRGDGDHDRDDGYYRGGQIYNRYPRGYPGGYGYPGGVYGYPGSVYGRGGYGNGGASSAGYNQGLQDGAYQARKDVAQGKPFNPNPRNGNHSDRGYHSYMGDKYAYQASYDQGYRSGYEANFGWRSRGWGF